MNSVKISERSRQDAPAARLSGSGSVRDANVASFDQMKPSFVHADDELRRARGFRRADRGALTLRLAHLFCVLHRNPRITFGVVLRRLFV
jgi:hypothetical protein